MTQQKKNSMKSLLYELTRVGEWWLLSLAMVLFIFIPYLYRLNNDSLSVQIFAEFFMTPDPYMVIAVAFSAQMFLFATNDYYDRHVDALDDKKKIRNPASAGRVTKRAVWALFISTLLISIAASIYFGIWAFLLTLFTMFVFYYYTAEPLRFKNKVGLDILSHAFLINTFPYLFAMIAMQYYTNGSIFLWIIIMLRSAMAQILQHTRDYHTDKKVERNTVISIGQRKAILIVLALYVALVSLTATLLVTHQLFGIGISHYYLIFLILALTYLPIFKGLLASDEYGDNIDRLWVGQGRTSLGMGARYAASFALYFGILFIM